MERVASLDVVVGIAVVADQKVLSRSYFHLGIESGVAACGASVACKFEAGAG